MGAFDDRIEALAAETGRATPFATVVTDLGSASTLWFHKALPKPYNLNPKP